MAKQGEETFEGHVAEGTRLFLDRAVKGLYLCESSVIEPPQIPFPTYSFQGLPALDKLLMEWGRNEASAKNEGYVGWHAKYLAACCYLLQGYKETNTQTTTRTIRCAVIMINQVLSNLYVEWGDNAFSLWPALALKGYILASVGRYSEPVRRAIIPQVSSTLRTTHEKPMLFPYRFNPVKLLNALVGYGEESVAETLKLPYLPERSGWSWADLGLLGIHDHAARRATTLYWSPSSLDNQASPSRSPHSESQRTSSSTLSYQNSPSFYDEGSVYDDYQKSTMTSTTAYASPMPSELIARSRHKQQRRGDKRTPSRKASRTYLHKCAEVTSHPPHSDPSMGYFPHSGEIGAWQPQSQMAHVPSHDWAGSYPNDPPDPLSNPAALYPNTLGLYPSAPSPYLNAPVQGLYGSSTSSDSNYLLDPWAQSFDHGNPSDEPSQSQSFDSVARSNR